jgi:hypothetical protein
MKSHDLHVWIEWILPAMVRGYVREHVWLALSECLGNIFFSVHHVNIVWKEQVIIIGEPSQARLMCPHMLLTIYHKTTFWIATSPSISWRILAPVIVAGGQSITTTPFVKFLMSRRNGWSGGRNCWCLSNDEYLPLLGTCFQMPWVKNKATQNVNG